jgi:tetratricopeptide (TPR) repeat protein
MKQQPTTPRDERKIKFAEAGVLFVLFLALTIFVGVRIASHGDPVDGGAAVATAPLEIQVAVPTPEAIAIATAEPDTNPAATVTVTVPREVTYAMAEQTYFGGEYAVAADLFDVYTAEHPGSAWGFYMLGLSEWKAGEPDAAEEAFLVALELKPDHVKSLINYSRVLIELKRPAEARTQIELALANAPDNVDANRMYSRICHAEGRFDDAVGSYLKVLQSRPEDVWSLNNLGLIRIEQGRYAEALAPLAKAVGLRGDLACAQNNLGVALERTGHFAAAASAYEAALAADSGYAKADESLARVSGLVGTGDPSEVDLVELAAGFSARTDVAAVSEATEQ